MEPSASPSQLLHSCYSPKNIKNQKNNEDAILFKLSKESSQRSQPASPNNSSSPSCSRRPSIALQSMKSSHSPPCKGMQLPHFPCSFPQFRGPELLNVTTSHCPGPKGPEQHQFRMRSLMFPDMRRERELLFMDDLDAVSVASYISFDDEREMDPP
mmetsp:Transcript_2734/g.3895  ORF Transcript_2734/g.3895 Transcript_2734/m.3895 type:complete len:156 (+) Transcript_2734:324-791(+)